MSRFQIKFEWEAAPRVRVSELAATWARLEILLEDEVLTKVEVNRTQSVRDGIYVPLFPIAEWVVANWWLLWNGYRTSSRGSAHNLLSAREGFALPNISFAPTETEIGVHWCPLIAPSAGLRFLSGGSRVVGKQHVESEFRRLVDGVLERLSSNGLHSYLFDEWNAIQEAEQDPETRPFCERVARLGLDPFDIDDSIAGQIENLGTLLPEPMLDDFCDVIPLSQIDAGASVVGRFVDSARNQTPASGNWVAFRESTGQGSAGRPWRDGYSQARLLRQRLMLTGPVPEALEQYLSGELGSLQTIEFSPPDRIDAISVPTSTSAPVLGLRSQLHEESKRFNLCRALGDYLHDGQPSLVTRARTEHQQRNRAFAAEFLAPADLIRRKLRDHWVGEQDIEDIAREFRVSDFVIRHQMVNHNLAQLNV